MKLNISEQLARIAITAAAAICGAVFSMSTALAQDFGAVLTVNQSNGYVSSRLTGGTVLCCQAIQSANMNLSAPSAIGSPGLYNPADAGSIRNVIVNSKYFVSGGSDNSEFRGRNDVVVYDAAAAFASGDFDFRKPYMGFLYIDQAGGTIQLSPGILVGGITGGTARVVRNGQVYSVDRSGLINGIGQAPTGSEISYAWQWFDTSVGANGIWIFGTNANAPTYNLAADSATDARVRVRISDIVGNRRLLTVEFVAPPPPEGRVTVFATQGDYASDAEYQAQFRIASNGYTPATSASIIAQWQVSPDGTNFTDSAIAAVTIARFLFARGTVSGIIDNDAANQYFRLEMIFTDPPNAVLATFYSVPILINQPTSGEISISFSDDVQTALGDSLTLVSENIADANGNGNFASYQWERKADDSADFNAITENGTAANYAFQAADFIGPVSERERVFRVLATYQDAIGYQQVFTAIATVNVNLATPTLESCNAVGQTFVGGACVACTGNTPVRDGNVCIAMLPQGTVTLRTNQDTPDTFQRYFGSLNITNGVTGGAIAYVFQTATATTAPITWVDDSRVGNDDIRNFLGSAGLLLGGGILNNGTNPNRASHNNRYFRVRAIYTDTPNAVTVTFYSETVDTQRPTEGLTIDFTDMTVTVTGAVLTANISGVTDGNDNDDPGLGGVFYSFTWFRKANNGVEFVSITSGAGNPANYTIQDSDFADLVIDQKPVYRLIALYRDGIGYGQNITAMATVNVQSETATEAPPAWDVDFDKENLLISVEITSLGGGVLRCCVAIQFENATTPITGITSADFPSPNFISGAPGADFGDNQNVGSVAVYNVSAVLNASFDYTKPFIAIGYDPVLVEGFPGPTPIRVAGITGGTATIEKNGQLLSVVFSGMTNVVGQVPIPEELTYVWQTQTAGADADAWETITSATLQTYTAPMSVGVRVLLTDKAGLLTAPQTVIAIATPAEVVTPPALLYTLVLDRTSKRISLTMPDTFPAWDVFSYSSATGGTSVNLGVAEFDDNDETNYYSVANLLTVGFDFTRPFFGFDGTADTGDLADFSNRVRVAGIMSGEATIAKNSLVLSVNISGLINVLGDAPNSHELSFQWEMPDGTEINGATLQTYTAASGATVRVQIIDKAAATTFSPILATADVVAPAESKDSCNLKMQGFVNNACVVCAAPTPVYGATLGQCRARAQTDCTTAGMTFLDADSNECRARLPADCTAAGMPILDATSNECRARVVTDCTSTQILVSGVCQACPSQTPNRGADGTCQAAVLTEADCNANSQVLSGGACVSCAAKESTTPVYDSAAAGNCRATRQSDCTGTATPVLGDDNECRARIMADCTDDAMPILGDNGECRAREMADCTTAGMTFFDTGTSQCRARVDGDCTGNSPVVDATSNECRARRMTDCTNAAMPILGDDNECRARRMTDCTNAAMPILGDNGECRARQQSDCTGATPVLDGNACRARRVQISSPQAPPINGAMYTVSVDITPADTATPTYQWQGVNASGVATDLSGATGNVFVLMSDTWNTQYTALRVRAVYNSLTLTPTPSVQIARPAQFRDLRILPTTMSLAVGVEITASGTVTDENNGGGNPGSFSYVWKNVAGGAIVQTGAVFTLNSTAQVAMAEAGDLFVQITATDSLGYTAESEEVQFRSAGNIDVDKVQAYSKIALNVFNLLESQAVFGAIGSHLDGFGKGDGANAAAESALQINGKSIATGEDIAPALAVRAADSMHSEKEFALDNFAWQKFGAAGSEGKPAWSTWVRGGWSSLEGNPQNSGDLRYDGKSFGIYGGVDRQFGDIRAGVAVGRSEVDLSGDFSEENDGKLDDKIRRELQSFLPYAEWKKDAAKVRVVGGIGRGELEISGADANDCKAEMDVEWLFGGVSGEYQIFAADKWETSLLGDISYGNSESEAGKCDGGTELLATSGGGGEFLFGGRVSYREEQNGSYVSPRIGLDARKLFGDVDDDVAYDINGGLSFGWANIGLLFDIEGSWQWNETAHQRKSFGGRLSYQRGAYRSSLRTIMNSGGGIGGSGNGGIASEGGAAGMSHRLEFGFTNQNGNAKINSNLYVERPAATENPDAKLGAEISFGF